MTSGLDVWQVERRSKDRKSTRAQAPEGPLYFGLSRFNNLFDGIGHRPASIDCQIAHPRGEPVMRIIPSVSKSLLLLSLPLLLIVSASFAEKKSDGKKDKEKGEWIDLFNGKDLSGWQNAREPEVDSGWTVEDGAMTNKEGANDIATKELYKDFVLRLEYKTVKGGNSGVFLRGRTEVQVFDSYGKEQPSLEDNGAIYGQFVPKVNASKPAGEWNSLKARYSGNILSVYLNGQLIHDKIQLDTVSGGALPGGVTDPGPIRLQGDHGKVWYRNLQIRPITGKKAEEK